MKKFLKNFENSRFQFFWFFYFLYTLKALLSQKTQNGHFDDRPPLNASSCLEKKLFKLITFIVVFFMQIYSLTNNITLFFYSVFIPYYKYLSCNMCSCAQEKVNSFWKSAEWVLLLSFYEVCGQEILICYGYDIHPYHVKIQWI